MVTNRQYLKLVFVFALFRMVCSGLCSYLQYNQCVNLLKGTFFSHVYELQTQHHMYDVAQRITSDSFGWAHLSFGGSVPMQHSVLLGNSGIFTHLVIVSQKISFATGVLGIGKVMIITGLILADMAVMYLVTKPLTRLTRLQSAAEGEFRRFNSYVINNA